MPKKTKATLSEICFDFVIPEMYTDKIPYRDAGLKLKAILLIWNVERNTMRLRLTFPNGEPYGGRNEYPADQFLANYSVATK